MNVMCNRENSNEIISRMGYRYLLTLQLETLVLYGYTIYTIRIDLKLLTKVILLLQRHVSDSWNGFSID